MDKEQMVRDLQVAFPDTLESAAQKISNAIGEQFAEVERSIPVRVINTLYKELQSALEPLVPFKKDPLEFSNVAHDVKNAHILQALKILDLYHGK